MGSLVAVESYMGEKIKFSEFLRKYLVFVKKPQSDNSAMHSFPTREDAREFIRQKKEAEEKEEMERAGVQRKLIWYQE